MLALQEGEVPLIQLFSRSRHKLGFTLTELAIVLGVVGIVAGGLWMAVGANNSSLRVKKGTDAVLFIVQRMRALHANRPRVDPNADMMTTWSETPIAIGTTAATRSQLTYIDQGVFPPDMVDGGNRLINPWGGSVNLKANANRDGFVLMLSRIKRDDCATLLLSLGGEGRDTKLTMIKTSTAGDDPSIVTSSSRTLGDTVDITTTIGSEGCRSDDGRNNVAFYFLL